MSCFECGRFDVFALDYDTGNGIIEKTVRVWLPSSYGQTDERYPVVYMQDGQNLFGDEGSFAGGWHIDDTMKRLSEDGKHVGIVVAIDNDVNRFNEYCPPYAITSEKLFRSQSCDSIITAPQGDFYLKFLLQLKKLVDVKYKTKPQREFTSIGGSSMGGLISLYAALKRPEVYGSLLCLSPCLFIFKRKSIEQWLFSNVARLKHTNICLYVGGEGFEEQFVEDTLHLNDKLNECGATVLFVHIPQNSHNENAWAEIMPTFLPRLF